MTSPLYRKSVARFEFLSTKNIAKRKKKHLIPKAISYQFIFFNFCSQITDYTSEYMYEEKRETMYEFRCSAES